MTAKDRIILALDVDSLTTAEELVVALSPYVSTFKVGLELVSAFGAPRVIDRVHRLGGKIFFDGKFNDIPNTVAGAVRAVAKLGVEMIDVHASGGTASIQAAAAHKGRAKLLAVTVLTSLTDDESQKIFGAPAREKVLQFARDAVRAGADGIVCSPNELDWLHRESALHGILKVTPGIRPEWAGKGDQNRFMTPKQAILCGATHLVIGRPITAPPTEIGSPIHAVERILNEIDEAI